MSRPREATSVATSTEVLPALKSSSAGLALGLRLVAVDRVGVDVVAPQLVREAVRADARAGEHQHLLQAARLDQVGEQLALLLARHEVQHVGHELGRGVARRHLHLGRVAQQRLDQVADLVREGGREEQVLPLAPAAAR